MKVEDFGGMHIHKTQCHGAPYQPKHTLNKPPTQRYLIGANKFEPQTEGKDGHQKSTETKAFRHKIVGNNCPPAATPIVCLARKSHFKVRLINITHLDIAYERNGKQNGDSTNNYPHTHPEFLTVQCVIKTPKNHLQERGFVTLPCIRFLGCLCFRFIRSLFRSHIIMCDRTAKLIHFFDIHWISFP